MDANAPIVVGVDGSESSNDAVRWAARDAVRRSAPLHLVSTMYVAGTYGVPVGLPPAYFDDHEVVGRRRLARALEVARAEALPHPLAVDSELVWGHPGGLLLERAHAARMLVVGSRGLGEVSGGLLGSVSATVAAHAGCPVAVIRELADPEGPEGGSVLVGVDGTRNSEPALVEAFTEASLRGAELVAVHAWSDTNIGSLFTADRGLDWLSIQEREEAQLSESLAGLGEDFPGVRVTRVVVKDQPARELTELSDHAQLVVVGCRGRGGFASLLLGSTSRALLHAIARPLLIVHAH
ncbi:universal stress protein [Rhodococcus sp. NPDC003348]